MHVAIASMFQNSQKYMDRYISQIYSLKAAAPEHTFDLILAEGDSTDSGWTWNRLNEIFPGKAFKREHHGKIYGSIDVEKRWSQIAFVVDGILERVQPQHDAMLYVEADLLWEPSTMINLLKHLERVECVVPMIWMNGIFYDIWAYKKDGIKFTGRPPYHPSLNQQPVGGLYPIDSGGGCVAVKGTLARTYRCRPESLAICGFFAELKSHGHQTWLDKTLGIHHPVVP